MTKPKHINKVLRSLCAIFGQKLDRTCVTHAINGLPVPTFQGLVGFLRTSVQTCPNLVNRGLDAPLRN